MLYNAWPATLTFLLKSCDLSQAQLAVRLRMNEQTVSRWTLGRTRPRASDFDAIAGGFACSKRQLGKIYSRLLADHYWRDDAPAPGVDGGELHGDADARPRRRTVLERAEALLRLDLEPVAPEMRSLLRSHRNSLRNLVAQFCGQAEVLISEFEQMLEAACRQSFQTRTRS